MLTVDSFRYNVPVNEMFEIPAQHRVNTVSRTGCRSQTRVHQAEIKNNLGASAFRKTNTCFKERDVLQKPTVLYAFVVVTGQSEKKERQ